MGIKLTKETCSLSLDELKNLKNKLESENSNLDFLIVDRIASQYHNSFIQCYNELRNYLIKNFNEPITEMTADILLQIENGTFFLKKIFALIISDNQVLGFQEVTIEDLKSVTFETLYLSDKLRGKSLGKFLVSASLIRCIEQLKGLKQIETNVNEQNIQVLKTLEPFGFYAKISIKELITNTK